LYPSADVTDIKSREIRLLAYLVGVQEKRSAHTISSGKPGRKISFGNLNGRILLKRILKMYGLISELD
jgi:hypothetical protein